MLDSVISASTLVAAVIFILTKVSLEAWLGAIISVIIIKSGVEMLKDTISKLLGEKGDAKFAHEIKETVTSYPGVSGAYDLVLNNYGPDTLNYSASEIDELIRQISVDVYSKHNVLLTAIGVYSVNTSNDEAARMRDEIYAKITEYDYVLQAHGFFVNEEKKLIRFDVVISLDADDRHKVYEKVVAGVREMYPDYELQIAMDTDFSEE